MWQEYCKNNWIKYEKVKWSEAMQNYYFTKNNFTNILQTQYPFYLNNDFEVLRQLKLIYEK